MEFYRFRSIDSLLGKHKELENLEIYFAPQDALNDPLEGRLNHYFEGDYGAYKGLFNHYLLCLDHAFTMLLLNVEIEELKKIAIFKTMEDLPTKIYKQRMEEIRRAFYVPVVEELIQLLSHESLSLREDELVHFFRLIHLFVVDIILKNYLAHGFIPQKEYKWDKIFDEEDLNKILKVDVYRNVLNMSDKERIFLKETIKYTESLLYQNQLIRAVDFDEEDIQNRKWRFLTYDFPTAYLDSITRLMYPKTYVACFSSRYDNSSMWGNYADNHRGVCLIYDTEAVSNESMSLKLTFPEYNLYNEQEGYRIQSLEIHPVTYGVYNTRINFFNNLGSLNRAQIEEILLLNTEYKSSMFDSFYNNKDLWRLKHWEHYEKSICNKSLDWSFEEELRLYIDNRFYNCNPIESRKGRYDFNSLKGIIFGYKMSDSDKIEILKVVMKLCAEHNRTRFEFYEAKFNSENDKIEINKLDWLSKFEQRFSI